MQSERFRTLAESKGPYASVYFDDSHDTEDAAAQRDLKWRAVRDELEQQGAQPEVIEALQHAIVDAAPAVGRSGRGLVAGADGVLLNEHLIRPIETPVVRVSSLPYLVPVVEHGALHSTYVVVTVDHAGADIALHRDQKVESDTVDGGGHPIHKADSAETPGYGDPQRRTMEAGRKNLRAVAERLANLVDDLSPRSSSSSVRCSHAPTSCRRWRTAWPSAWSNWNSGHGTAGSTRPTCSTPSTRSSCDVASRRSSMRQNSSRKRSVRARGWPPRVWTVSVRRCARAPSKH